MHLTIHRGTPETGAVCVEIGSARGRIVVDLGKPLVGAAATPPDPQLSVDALVPDLKRRGVLPDVPGLYRGEERSIEAVFLARARTDHGGFLPYVHPAIPIYVSEGARQLIEVAHIFLPSPHGPLSVKTIKRGRSFTAADLTITPYPVDHAVPDALAFLIEGEGQRIFLSGDTRGQGRDTELFTKLTARSPGPVDVLLMDTATAGTVGPACPCDDPVHRRLEHLLRTGKGITFLCASSQESECLIAAYKACLRTRRIFVIDLSAAYLFDKLRKVSKRIPLLKGKNLRIRFLKHQADILAKKVSTSLLYYYSKYKIDVFGIAREKDRVLILAQDTASFPALVKELKRTDGARVIYAMGTEPPGPFVRYCAERDMEIVCVHPVSHATVEDVKAFAHAVNPQILIPLYPSAGDQSLFSRVALLPDKGVFVVAGAEQRIAQDQRP